MSEQQHELPEHLDESPQAQPQVMVVRRPWYRRVGCLIALLIWLMVMLLPCFFLALAFQQEIVITQGDAPNQVLRIWLINEVRDRGFGISSTSVHPGLQNSGVCVQTDVRFILWVGDSPPTSYCECYALSSEELEITSVQQGQCTP